MVLGEDGDVFDGERIHESVEGAADFQGSNESLSADEAGEFLDGDFLADMVFELGGGEAHGDDDALEELFVAGSAIAALFVLEIGADGADEFLVRGGDAEFGGFAEGRESDPGHAAQGLFGFGGGGEIAAGGQGAGHEGAQIGGAVFAEGDGFAVQSAGGIQAVHFLDVRRPNDAPDDERENDDDQKTAPQQAGLDQLVEFRNHHGHGGIFPRCETFLPFRPEKAGAKHDGAGEYEPRHAGASG